MQSAIAVIGAGHMGSALISGLISQHYPPKQIFACDPSVEKLAYLQQTFGISVSTHNEEAIEQAETIIFAVKPNAMQAAVSALAARIHEKKSLVISIAAGVREKRVQEWLGGKVAVVRAMPNMPALIGCGATALYANSYTSPTQRKLAEAILRCVGLVVWLDDEKQIDAVTALSGSGPAYFFLLIEALQEAGKKLGLPEETTRLLALQTAYGATRLALESGESVAELRRRVASPGGTTERALHVLDQGRFHELMLEALTAAKKHSEDLAVKH